MKDRRPFTITKVRQEDGIWKARVSCDGTTLDVARDPVWTASVRVRPGARTFEKRHVLPHVAAALQAKLPAAERKPRTRAGKA